MDTSKPDSIFTKYYSRSSFLDRFGADPDAAVDVIIPLLTVNEYFHTNLSSVYAEIPVNRLLIGDGGCNDETLQILSEFPRVELIDQKNNKTHTHTPPPPNSHHHYHHPLLPSCIEGHTAYREE